jgi:hypothetical protein
VTEIDDDIAIFYGWLDGITQVALRDDIDVRIGFGKIDNSSSHAPSRANH